MSALPSHVALVAVVVSSAECAVCSCSVTAWLRFQSHVFRVAVSVTHARSPGAQLGAAGPGGRSSLGRAPGVRQWIGEPGFPIKKAPPTWPLIIISDLGRAESPSAPPPSWPLSIRDSCHLGLRPGSAVTLLGHCLGGSPRAPCCRVECAERMAAWLVWLWRVACGLCVAVACGSRGWWNLRRFLRIY